MNNSTLGSGHLWVVAAASGTGKTTLVKALVAQVDNLVISISHTTREPRPQEMDGRDYFFISAAEFQQLIAQNIFLEHASIYHYDYGTSRAWVMSELARGHDVILEIDWQGALQIRSRWPMAQLIFILPPSLQVLKERLQKRRQDSAIVIERRLAGAVHEIAHYAQFDYLVVNDDFNTALTQLTQIIAAARCRRDRQEQRYARLIAELLD